MNYTIKLSRGGMQNMQNNHFFSSTVRVGPQQYICEEGVLESLPDHLRQLDSSNILIIHGKESWKKARNYLKNIYRSNFSIHEFLFSGECTETSIDQLKELIMESGVDTVIGVGGGKIMDAVKYAAYLADRRPFILIPTLASNCAPWTPVSVLYHADGSFDRLDVLPAQASLLLVEPRLIIDAPREYFIAGMADTLAKWYESEEILAQSVFKESPILTMARAAAKICQTTILEKGQQALADLEQGRLSEEFRSVSEVIISISGMVGGMGDDLARTTIAHEIHDAVTIYPESHQFLHGHKVGYGILVQLAVENKWSEITKLQLFYRSLGIPTSLFDMGLSHLTESEIDFIAIQASKPELPVHHLPYPVNAAIIASAIHKLEAF